ncbi:MAG: YihY/virulence factor BrkB family protein [Burkholderiales bacterium]|nr:YihY/virulence factor BrkB family protein [Burkholderiales bacterium]
MGEVARVAAKSTRGTPAQWRQLVKGAGAAWIDDYAPSMGAALSYYTVFSLAPLLLMVISIAGLVFGEEAARGEIFGQLHQLMGADAAKAIEGLLSSVNKPAEGTVATLLGVGLLLVGATTVFGELQDSLDRIWRAPARERSAGWWNLLRTRLLSFGMILGIAFLLMVSLVLGAMISAFGKWWGGYFPGWEVLAQGVNLLIGFLLAAGVFAMIYKLMPRVSVRWHDVWLGAVVTALLFTVGKFLIGLYIGKSGIASGFGAAGSLIVVFVWVYYSAQIFLMGAEFTWVYARTFGSMRSLDEAATEEVAPDLPSRSEDLPPAPPAPPPLTQVRIARRPRRTTEPAWRKLGIGVAAGVALRYLVPRLLRRR